jgi:hypothetical protein
VDDHRRRAGPVDERQGHGGAAQEHRAREGPEAK